MEETALSSPGEWKPDHYQQKQVPLAALSEEGIELEEYPRDIPPLSTQKEDQKRVSCTIFSHTIEHFPDGRVIVLLAVMQVMGFSFFFLVGFVETVVIVLLWGFIAVGLYLYVRWAHYHSYNNTLSAAVCRGLLMGVFALAILLYYEGTQGTVHELRTRNPSHKLYDGELLNFDRYLLGWAFTDGQLALWTDTHRIFGPQSAFGPIITEVLQIYYARYKSFIITIDCSCVTLETNSVLLN